MKNYIRTDMAAEFTGTEAKKTGHDQPESGVSAEWLTLGEQDAEKLGRKPGNYATITFPRLVTASEETVREVSEKCAGLLREFTVKLLGRRPASILCALLGNRLMTPDAIGPMTGDALTVTRHIKSARPDIFRLLGGEHSPCELSAVTPGVLAQTGIETLELIRGAAEHVKPELIIAVDALAARSPDRLCRTLQLTDAGISPGSGIGNRRTELSRETLGRPVIALGVPTVIDSSSLVADVLESCGTPPDAFGDELTRTLENGRSFLVSPKDMDESARLLSGVISDAINAAFVSCG